MSDPKRPAQPIGLLRRWLERVGFVVVVVVIALVAAFVMAAAIDLMTKIL